MPKPSACSWRHYPLSQGRILLILLIYVGIDRLVDVLYAYIKPRIDCG